MGSRSIQNYRLKIPFRRQLFLPIGEKIVIEREPNDSPVAIARDDHRIAVDAHPVHRGCEILPRSREGDCSRMDGFMDMSKIGMLFFIQFIPRASWRGGFEAEKAVTAFDGFGAAADHAFARGIGEGDGFQKDSVRRPVGRIESRGAFDDQGDSRRIDAALHDQRGEGFFQSVAGIHKSAGLDRKAALIGAERVAIHEKLQKIREPVAIGVLDQPGGGPLKSLELSRPVGGIRRVVLDEEIHRGVGRGGGVAGAWFDADDDRLLKFKSETANGVSEPA